MWLTRYAVRPFLTIWLALTLTFFLLRLLPGDAISGQMGIAGATEDEIEARRTELNLNKSELSQYLDYLANILNGDFGTSLTNGLPVIDLILPRLQVTLTLSCSALLVACLLGGALGIIATVPKVLCAHLAKLVLVSSFSLPIYWTATIALLIFVVRFNWLPAAGSDTPAHFILPILLLGFHSCGAIGRMVENSILQTRKLDYVVAGRSKGLTERYIYTHYVLRPTLIPIISVIALQAGFLLSGTVIIETIFAQPGLGNLLVTSTLNQDYPVVQGMAVVITIIYISVNTFADLMFAVIDPRIHV